jgi:acyl-CoA synthetase (AMP-forming)/AMP-acid ligase II
MTASQPSPQITVGQPLRKIAFSNSTTLGSMLQERAKGPQGEDIRLLFVDGPTASGIKPPEGDDESLLFTYSELYELTCRAASCFRRQGVGVGDRVFLFLSTGPAFLAAFYACQMLGAIAVPIAPPRSLSQLVGHLSRLAQICEPVLTVVGTRFMPLFRLARRSSRHALKRVVEEMELFLSAATLDEPYPVEPSDPAIIQFTSGSTGKPKGVTLSHTNLFANIKAIGIASGFRDGDVALCWLPLFHDMGLIGHVLNAMLWRVGLVLMPPEAFMNRPGRWLNALSRYGVAHSTGPNFAYVLCVRKITDREIKNVDLGRWRLAYCGAEPVHPDTIRRFTEKFSANGFTANSFFPVYGLAEFTLAASFPKPGARPRYDRVNRVLFETQKTATPVMSDNASEIVEWVSVGQGMPAHQMRIVDSQGSRLGERLMGEIELAGPSLMTGYYRDPDATEEVIRNGWLRTGDLGYIADGDLFVTGRSKDLIIKGGRNIYPQDVERAASLVKEVRAGCCVAFSITNQLRGTEELVLVCETRIRKNREHARLKNEIRKTVHDLIATSVDTVRLVSPGTVLKTSSGKIRRQAMRERYLQGKLRPERTPLSLRTRLYIELIREQFRKLVRGRKHKVSFNSGSNEARK